LKVSLSRRSTSCCKKSPGPPSRTYRERGEERVGGAWATPVPAARQATSPATASLPPGRGVASGGTDRRFGRRRLRIGQSSPTRHIPLSAVLGRSGRGVAPAETGRGPRGLRGDIVQDLARLYRLRPPIRSALLLSRISLLPSCSPLLPALSSLLLSRSSLLLSRISLFLARIPLLLSLSSLLLNCISLLLAWEPPVSARIPLSQLGSPHFCRGSPSSFPRTPPSQPAISPFLERSPPSFVRTTAVSAPDCQPRFPVAKS